MSRIIDRESEMDPAPPLVSIIIAVRNGAATLGRCLDSVLEQSYVNREMIVLDAKSTDGSVDILRAFDGHIAYWKSEPDTGIYDAWNKGLSVAHGAWLCFIGADDYYADKHALADLMWVARSSDAEYVTSRCAIVNAVGERVKEFGLEWKWERERRHHFICHPGSLHRRSLFDRYGSFDERYRICADYDFNLRAGRCLKAGYLNRVVLCLGDSGVSRNRMFETIMETTRIQWSHPDIGPVRAMINRTTMTAEFVVYSILRSLGLHRRVRSWLVNFNILQR